LRATLLSDALLLSTQRN